MDKWMNAKRFSGFADLYNEARPKCPAQAREFLIGYLQHKPGTVVDLGCGTGLSTAAWAQSADEVIGVEPSDDMIRVARQMAAQFSNVRVVQALSDSTGLADESVDIVTCSQSFHWMNPQTTLAEVARILKPGGIFAAYDCDWPPVFSWRAEAAYERFFETVHEFENGLDDVKSSFVRWDKNAHLANIRKSGHFRYTREIVFSNAESCDAHRFLALGRSQGGLQKVLKLHPELIGDPLAAYEDEIRSILGAETFSATFCYRMRLGVK